MFSEIEGKKVFYYLAHPQKYFSVFFSLTTVKNNPNNDKNCIKIYLNFSIQNYRVELGAIKAASEMSHLGHVTFNFEIKAF